MDIDQIIEIGIDADRQLYLKPAVQKFPYIYREAKGVQWNENDRSLYGKAPVEWSYVDWYEQIINIVKEQSCCLVLTNKTLWVNIPEKLKSELLNLEISH